MTIVIDDSCLFDSREELLSPSGKFKLETRKYRKTVGSVCQPYITVILINIEDQSEVFRFTQNAYDSFFVFFMKDGVEWLISRHPEQTLINLNTLEGFHTPLAKNIYQFLPSEDKKTAMVMTSSKWDCDSLCFYDISNLPKISRMKIFNKLGCFESEPTGEDFRFKIDRNGIMSLEKIEITYDKKDLEIPILLESHNYKKEKNSIQVTNIKKGEPIMTLTYFLKAYLRGKKHLRTMSFENAVFYRLFNVPSGFETPKKWRLEIGDKETEALLDIVLQLDFWKEWPKSLFLRKLERLTKNNKIKQAEIMQKYFNKARG